MMWLVVVVALPTSAVRASTSPVEAVDVGCCGLNEIIQTDFGDRKVVGVVRTIHFRCRLRNQLLD